MFHYNTAPNSMALLLSLEGYLLAEVNDRALFSLGTAGNRIIVRRLFFLGVIGWRLMPGVIDIEPCGWFAYSQIGASSQLRIYSVSCINRSSWGFQWKIF